MDIWSKEKRSEVMSKIKGKNTKPELMLRSELFKEGFRFRVHQKDLPGKPDIVLARYRTAIFVHGCFWHYHRGCREGRIPSTESVFWKTKLEGNRAKDRRNIKLLQNLGWQVLTVWECEIEKDINKVIEFLSKKLKSNSIE